MDWIRLLRLVIILVAILVLGLIAASPGLAGKVFVGLLIIGAFWYFIRQQNASKVVNPVTVYYQRLLDLCHLNQAPNLRFIQMGGDKFNQTLLKGLITGGPVEQINKGLMEQNVERPSFVKDEEGKFVLDDQGNPKAILDKDGNQVIEVVKEIRFYPATLEELKKENVPESYWVKGEGKVVGHYDLRSQAYIFSYTTRFTGVWAWPIVGWVLLRLLGRPEFLMCVYKYQLREQSIFGDISVKGVSTTFVGMMEFSNDFTHEPKVEMQALEASVHQTTLLDTLSRLPTIVKLAVDSNPMHSRALDMRDTLSGQR